MYVILAVYVFLLQSSMLCYRNKDPKILRLELFTCRFRYTFIIRSNGNYAEKTMRGTSLCRECIEVVSFFLEMALTTKVKKAVPDAVF